MTGWLVSVQHTGLFGIVTGLGKARAKSLTPEQRRRIARAAAKARWKKITAELSPSQTTSGIYSMLLFGFRPDTSGTHRSAACGIDQGFTRRHFAGTRK